MKYQENARVKVERCVKNYERGREEREEEREEGRCERNMMPKF